VVTVFTSLIVVPMLIARIPPDYFAQSARPPSAWAKQHPIVRAGMTVGKNVLGVVLMLAGVAMLLLPGQCLMLLAGFMLLDFPGKYRLEKWLVARPSILHTVNWLRQRSGYRPLTVQGPC